MVGIFLGKQHWIRKSLQFIILCALFVPAKLWSEPITANSALNITIAPINLISIDASSVTLTVNSATPGSQPNQASDLSSVTYNITTNCSSNTKKLTASINPNMPAGLTLSVNLDAPTGAASAGTVNISSSAASPANVVTGIDGVAQTGIPMRFYLNATVAAGAVSSSITTLTLTLTDT